MTPRLNDTTLQPDSRAWWLPSRNIIDELIQFYNNNIVPVTLNTPITTFTKEAFITILQHPVNPPQLEFENHITTIPCSYVTRKSTSSPYILCKHCCNIVEREQLITDSPTNIIGGKHAVFELQHIHIMPKVKSLWCAKCRIPLFIWIPGEECINNAVFH